MIEDKPFEPFELGGQKYQNISAQFKKLLSRVYAKVHCATTLRPQSPGNYQPCSSIFKNRRPAGSYNSLKRRHSKPTDASSSNISITKSQPAIVDQYSSGSSRSASITPNKKRQNSIGNHAGISNNILVTKRCLFDQIVPIKKRKLLLLMGKISQEQPILKASSITPMQSSITTRKKQKMQTRCNFFRTQNRFKTQQTQKCQKNDLLPWQTSCGEQFCVLKQ